MKLKKKLRKLIMNDDKLNEKNKFVKYTIIHKKKYGKNYIQYKVSITEVKNRFSKAKKCEKFLKINMCKFRGML